MYDKKELKNLKTNFLKLTFKASRFCYNFFFVRYFLLFSPLKISRLLANSHILEIFLESRLIV